MVDENSIKTVIDGIFAQAQKEIEEMKESDLEKFWHFQYDPKASFETNLYNFYDMLGMYHRTSREWEEFHHGSVCVVERVRDKYLMPKIKQFGIDSGNIF